MTGITPGRPWDSGGFHDLRMEGYAGAAAQLAALTTVVNATRGIAWSPEQVAAFYGHPAFDLARDARLVWVGNTPVAAAICYPTIHFPDRPPGNFEIFVVPDARGHGLGGRLLAHLEQAAPQRGHHVLETTIDQHDAPGRRFLLAHGFQVVGQRARLARPTLADLPEGTLPPGFRLDSLASDPAAPDTYRDLCNRLGAHDPDYTLLQPEDMQSLVAGPAWDPAGIFVLADPEGRDVGLIRASGSPGGTGYLHEIRLHPAYRGRNLGAALVGAALVYLAAGGAQRAELDAESTGSPAYRLAVRGGFVETHRWQQYLKPLA